MAASKRTRGGWTQEEDQILVDAMLRNESTKSMATHLPNRSRSAATARQWTLYGAAMRNGSSAKVLPRNWTSRQQMTIPSYTLNEDEELVRWRCNRCTGLDGTVFDDSQSKESLRSRIAVLELESKAVTKAQLAAITVLVKKYRKRKINWNKISSSLEARIGSSISASLCMAAWYFVGKQKDRRNHPLYKPFRPVKRSLVQYIEPEGPPEKPLNAILNDPNLARLLRLNYTDLERQAYIDGIKTVYLRRLPAKCEYPPRNTWVCENIAIRDLWEEHMTNGPLDDERTSCKGMHDLDVNKLQYIVELGESVRLVDADTGELIAEIQRNFVPDAGVLKSINGMADRNCGLRRNVRRDDPGTIVQTGYSAGSKDLRNFIWARNLTTSLSEEEIRDLNYTTSSAYALFWNMLKNSVPASLIEDTNELVRRTGMPRMDSNFKGKRPDCRYKVETGGLVFEFTDGELAPPSGVCGGNYSRYTHNEINATSNILSLTTHRSLPVEAGGNFYSASYAFLIRSEPNTLVTHRCQDFHGTTLAQVDPKASRDMKDLYQTGISILIQKRLPEAWRDYCQGPNPDVTAIQAEAFELEVAAEEEEYTEMDCDDEMNDIA